MSRVAVIAALPLELRGLVRGWTHETRSGVDLWSRTIDGRTWIAACGGCGAAAARRAFAEVLRTGPVESVCSVGVAGALHARLSTGAVYPVSTVINADSGERFVASGDKTGLCLVSAAAVAGTEDKRQLGSKHLADLVDMEAAEVARLANEGGIAFYCVKGVSDGISDPLPPMNRYLTAEGRIRMAGLVVHIILRPWLWPAMLRLNTNTRRVVTGFSGPLRLLFGWPT